MRTQREITLTELAAATGISKSTLSRLESGQRKPSLELLLPIAQAHRIPLEELIGAPEVGDPRVRFTPRRRNGRIVVPLTRNPGGIQAWKTIIPPEPGDPELRTHEGHEWLYVLAGRVRLILPTTTSLWVPARSPSSTPGCRTGSDLPATKRSRSSACWARRGNASTSAPRRAAPQSTPDLPAGAGRHRRRSVRMPRCRC